MASPTHHSHTDMLPTSAVTQNSLLTALKAGKCIIETLRYGRLDLRCVQVGAARAGSRSHAGPG
ncbi:hypothetical protein IG631_08624 [Alternaria alternata]|nr:hypothetical protein IG631_08624 [Alternaria alternata]